MKISVIIIEEFTKLLFKMKISLHKSKNFRKKIKRVG